nr:hypothetical protein [Tanacetum cinerariifolium]
GSGGAGGSGGAAGSGGTGENADRTSVRGAGPTVPELTEGTYVTFTKCDPLPFNGTEGAVGLCQWLERLESVYVNGLRDWNRCSKSYTHKTNGSGGAGGSGGTGGNADKTGVSGAGPTVPELTGSGGAGGSGGVGGLVVPVEILIEQYTHKTNGSGGAGGSGGTGENADRTGVSGAGPTVPELTGCTYVTFTKCDPLPFNGTEGAVGLCQWFERLESVYVNGLRDWNRCSKSVSAMKRI